MLNSVMLLKRAQASHAAGDLSQAVSLYQSVLRGDPKNYAANYLLGVALYQAGEAGKSIRYFDAAIAADPRRIEAHKDRGLVLLKLGDYAAAERSFAAALELRPESPDLQVNRGIALKNSGRAADSLACYEAALALRPEFAEAHNNLGNSLAELGRKEEALSRYERASALKPSYAEAWFNAANTLVELGRPADAARRYDHLLALDPRHAGALFARGLLHLTAEEKEAALSCFGRALESDPRHVAALLARGALLRNLERFDEAMADADAALSAEPGNVEALLLKGRLLRRAGRADEAIAVYDKAIARAPGTAEAYFGIGRAFQQKREFSAAALSFDEAIKHAPEVAAYHCERGRALSELLLLDQALEALATAIRLKPDDLQSHLVRAHILSKINRSDEALAAFERVREIEGGKDLHLGQRFAEKMKLCRWEERDADLAEIKTRLDAGEWSIDPFVSLSHLVEPALHKRCAEIHASRISPAEGLTRARSGGRPEKPVIGYFSGDFREHAMMFLMAELFERHDRGRFRFVAFSLKTAPENGMRKRVMGSFDAFHDVQDLSDREVFALADKEGIDIAVDLMGYTAFCRPSLFAARIAPVQVNYLGYPGTSGAGWMDYIIADPVLIPEDKRVFYSEKVASLPNSYQPNDRSRAIAEATPTRAELDLPEDAFVFCCFNNSLKITPEVFAMWMRILGQAPGSVLWLLAYTEQVRTTLRLEAERHGIAGERLVFAKPIPLPDHLARHRQADLFLDTLPYNAHTTASDALWAGLPVLTRMGESFASRVAASLNRAVGMEEMNVGTVEEYEALALRFYRDRKALAALKQKLARNRADAPLFDAERYARDIENLYAMMLERRSKGEPPAPLFA